MNSQPSVTTTMDMAVLLSELEALPYGTESSRKPAVLGCRLLRRTVQVRLGTNPAVARDGCQVARPPRLSEQARDGGQARPSSWSRDGNS
jgi:hypothetical protein